MTASLRRCLAAVLLLGPTLGAQTPSGQAAHIARIERGIRPRPVVRGVAVMTNADNGALLASEIVSAVGREYDWPGLRELREHAEVAIDAKLLDGYVGRYQLRPGFVATVARAASDQQLTIQPSGAGQRPFTVFPEGPREFFAKVADIVIRFETDAQGRATTLVLMQGGGTTRLARIE
jgi:hypothetical protein